MIITAQIYREPKVMNPFDSNQNRVQSPTSDSVDEPLVIKIIFKIIYPTIDDNSASIRHGLVVSNGYSTKKNNMKYRPIIVVTEAKTAV